MDSRRSSWSGMEMDCLVEIFIRLDLDDLTLAVPFVCKQWLAAAHHPLCWKKLDFRRLDLLPWSCFSKSFSLHHSLPYFSFTYFLRLAVGRSFNSVTELKLPLKTTSIDDLVFAANECPKLRSIALPILPEEDEVQISELVCKWKNLERLELESSPSNLPDLVKKMSLCCKNITELSVSGVIREEDAFAIAGHLPKLKKLDLSGSYLQKTVLLVIVNGCRDLEELNVNGCFGFEEEDEEIGLKVSGIRDFRCEGCRLYRGDPFDCDGDRSNGFRLNGYVF